MIFDCRHHHDESSFSAIMGNCFLDTMDTMDRMGVQWGYIYILYILNGYNNIRITWDMTTNTNQSICAMVKTSVFFCEKDGRGAEIYSQGFIYPRCFDSYFGMGNHTT